MLFRVLLTAAFVLVLPFSPLTAQEEKPVPPRPSSVLIKTALGEFSIHLDWENAPENCGAFMRYFHDGVYASTSFDDTDEFCLYGGKPPQRTASMAANGNMIATAGPPGEFKLPNRKGAVGFRRTAGSCNPTKRSNCTQFYIMLKDHPEADKDFSVFGTVEGESTPVEAITAKVAGYEPVSLTIEPRDK